MPLHSTKYQGVIVRIAYYADDRTRDHVDVRLADGTVVPTYRFYVEETGPQECVEEDWRRSGP